MPQQGYYPDTAYYGTGRGSPEVKPTSENIPLQDRPGKDIEMDDHIYDAPRRRKNKKRKIGLGELGMIGADRQRIPWVVYVFTVIQVGVFIAEIVRNGMFPNHIHEYSCANTLSHSHVNWISHHDQASI